MHNHDMITQWYYFIVLLEVILTLRGYLQWFFSGIQIPLKFCLQNNLKKTFLLRNVFGNTKYS